MNKKKVLDYVGRFWLLLFALMVLLMFGIAEPNTLQPKNLLNIASSACLTAIAGIGATCVLSSGEFDLSAGSIMTMGAVFMVVFTKFLEINYFVAILLTLLSCALLGLLNAVLHVNGRIPAFCATFGTSFALSGFAKMLCDGTDLLGMSSVTVSYYTFLGQGYLFGIIPMPLVVLIVVCAIMIFYTEMTRSGKYLYAVGSNPTACKYIGINAKVQKYKGFVLCGLLCGLAGIVQGSMSNGCTPTLGASMMTMCIMVVMIGAMFNKIGVFNVPGTIVGSALLAIVNNGMTMLSAPSWLKDLVLGSILFISVSMVIIIRKRIEKN